MLPTPGTLQFDEHDLPVMMLTAAELEAVGVVFADSETDYQQTCGRCGEEVITKVIPHDE